MQLTRILCLHPNFALIVDHTKAVFNREKSYTVERSSVTVPRTT